jgi:hypothetical protein
MLDLGMNITCTCSVEDEDNHERVMFGSDDGFVYEMDKGTSFDGAEFFRYIRIPFNHCGSPGYLKRFHLRKIRLHRCAGHRDQRQGRV